eukprot:TRINITY_DN9195_c0_g1_i7.p1 TRINITY_DN9195_c0_g1~~TRINITY_DN9195_c0_g1_i7.p1  ORF type:complete len:106 (+),score=2.71 TRINITY_DN9195_c0_g1_i7:352-669(+)
MTCHSRTHNRRQGLTMGTFEECFDILRHPHTTFVRAFQLRRHPLPCLLYTSDAADEEDSVDLGGRRIIKKKKRRSITVPSNKTTKKQRAQLLGHEVLRKRDDKLY